MLFSYLNITYRIYIGVLFFLGTSFLPIFATAQTASIDPRLSEVVELIKERSLGTENGNLRVNQGQIARDTKPLLNLAALDALRNAGFSENPDVISKELQHFLDAAQSNDVFSIASIGEIYTHYIELLSQNATAKEKQNFLLPYSLKGTWFERYVALDLASYIHASEQERQAALQKSQLALTMIPQSENQNDYVDFAKAQITSAIAQLHNLQGNTELAIATTLDYLHLTEDTVSPTADVDILNNLIFSYSVARDRPAQIFIVEALLELEKAQTSSVPGLSELRIAAVKTDSGEYQDAINYAKMSLAKADHPTIIRQSLVMEAAAYAGLGHVIEARALARKAEVNLDRDHMLNEETRHGDLFLAFLLAQNIDKKYATELYNRRIDIISQRFLENNSRDTTAMLADLENSRERKAEREAAAEREAFLTEQTIDRQRKLNRALMVVSLILSLAALSAICFAQYRQKIMRTLKIKTKQAASAEKLKTEFLGMISHELRTPLNAIIGISDYLTHYHKDPDIRQKSSIILSGGNDLLSVVESLTDMARIDAGQMEIYPEETELVEMLQDIPSKWTDAAANKNLTLTHFIDPKLSRHIVDGPRLIQSINVLMANAIGFTTTGRVHLHITANLDGAGDVNGLTAIVADTGRGMSELVQSRLFTPFMQADTSRKRNHMGTGLNLAIAHALARKMHGDLTVVSREGRGSEFTLSVQLNPPRAEAEAVTLTVDEIERTPVQLEAPVLDTSTGPTAPVIDLMMPSHNTRGLHDAPKLESSAQPPAGHHILVVDDMESNREILRLMLETEGHSCDTAPGGYEAIEMLNAKPYDLVILDIHMTPLDGVATLERIRRSGASYASIPVVALTADNAAKTNADCMKAGADLFLTKPIRPAELRSAMTLLQNRTASQTMGKTA